MQGGSSWVLDLGSDLKLAWVWVDSEGDKAAPGSNIEDNFTTICSASEEKSVTTNKPSPGQQE